MCSSDLATQIAVKIRIKPQTRAYGSIVADIRRRFAMPEHPARAAVFDGRVDQTIASEAAPGFELGPKRWIATGNGYEIAPAAASERRDQFRE